MSAHDGDDEFGGGVSRRDFCSEGRCTHDVEGRDTEKSLRIEDFVRFHDFGNDGDGRVDGIGDDEDECFGTVYCDSLCQISNDASVNFEEI